MEEDVTGPSPVMFEQREKSSREGTFGAPTRFVELRARAEYRRSNKLRRF